MSEMSKQVHSIIFGDKNSYDDWHLVPTNRPDVNPPEVKTQYVEVLGVDGDLDYTEVLGGIKYKNRKGSWEFLVLNDFINWYTLCSNIMSYLHGKVLRVVLEDDPLYYYEGRLSLDATKSDKNNSKITIGYNFKPYKIPRASTGGEIPGYTGEGGSSGGKLTAGDWLWNELFEVEITYGVFDVLSSKWRNFYNGTEEDVPVSVTCSSPMVVTLPDESTINLPDGTTQNAFTLAPGDNIMLFTGNGRVTLDYYMGRAL